MLDEKNLIIPIQLTRIIYSHWKADLSLADSSSTQVYGKALHGPGQVTFKNGNSFTGNFHNGMLHGQGRFVWANGTIYEGQFKYNRIQGIGKYFWTDHSQYEGQVHQGLRHGQGIFKAPQGQYVYIGNWECGRRQGHGKLEFLDGTVYEGNFHKGIKHGEGRITFPTNNFYDGQWANDMKHGYGTMNWINRSQKYYGQWAQDMQNGFGVHIWLEPRGESKSMRNRYEGQWRNGLRHGIGTFYYANGSRYDGEWKDNLKEGMALFTDQFGIISQKMFIKDRPFKEEKTSFIDSLVSKPTETDKPKSGRDNRIAQSTPRVKKSSNIDPNPYSLMVRINDLTLSDYPSLKAIPTEMLNNMLLRNNSQLRSYYKHFVTKFEIGNENSFSLSFDGFWKCLKEIKVLGGKVSLASINRIFAAGVGSAFPMTACLSLLSDRVESIKAGTITQDEIRSAYFTGLALAQEGKRDFPKELVGQVNIHEGGRVVLFRQFVQLLVRIAYIKYGHLYDLNKSLERLFQKMFPAIDSSIKQEKKETTSSQDGMSSISFNIKRQIPAFAKIANELLFRRICNQPPMTIYKDATIKVHQVLQLLAGSGLLDTPDRLNLIHRLQKSMDPDRTTLELDNQERKNRKKNTQVTISAAERLVRERGVLQHELISNQFVDLIYMVIERKIDSSNVEERKVKYLEIINKIVQAIPAKKKMVYPRAKASVKDSQKQKLQRRRQEEREEAERNRLRREEREREEQQMLMLAYEDFDIPSDEEAVQNNEQDQDSFSI